MSRTSGALVVVALSTLGARSAPPRIEHDAIACAVVDRFVQIDATVSPAADVARTRVLFRATGADDWYWVAMQPEKTGVMRAFLPKPTNRLAAFEYYVDAQTKSFAETRTADHRVAVVARGSCPNGRLAGSVGSLGAKLVVTALGGGPALPAGFASSGLIAGTATTATTAAAGGGLSGTTLAVAGGVVAAAGAGLALRSGSEPQDAHVAMTFTPFPDGTACGGPATPPLGPGDIAAGNIVVPRAGGSFQFTKPDTAPYIRVSGQITPTTFSATLSCLSGAPATTLTANGTNYSFSGSYTFSGRSGTWTAIAPGLQR